MAQQLLKSWRKYSRQYYGLILTGTAVVFLTAFVSLAAFTIWVTLSGGEPPQKDFKRAIQKVKVLLEEGRKNLPSFEGEVIGVDIFHPLCEDENLTVFRIRGENWEGWLKVRKAKIPSSDHPLAETKINIWGKLTYISPRGKIKMELSPR